MCSSKQYQCWASETQIIPGLRGWNVGHLLTPLVFPLGDQNCSAVVCPCWESSSSLSAWALSFGWSGLLWFVHVEEVPPACRREHFPLGGRYCYGMSMLRKFLQPVGVSTFLWVVGTATVCPCWGSSSSLSAWALSFGWSVLLRYVHVEEVPPACWREHFPLGGRYCYGMSMLRKFLQPVGVSTFLWVVGTAMVCPCWESSSSLSAWALSFGWVGTATVCPCWESSSSLSAWALSFGWVGTATVCPCWGSSSSLWASALSFGWSVLLCCGLSMKLYYGLGIKL